MFFDRLKSLCEAQGESVSRLAKSLGLSTANPTEWKRGTIPRASVLGQIADRLNVSIDYLLGRTDIAAPTPTHKDDSIKFALFGDTEITDEVMDEVRSFAQFVAARERGKSNDKA